MKTLFHFMYVLVDRTGDVFLKNRRLREMVMTIFKCTKNYSINYRSDLLCLALDGGNFKEIDFS